MDNVVPFELAEEPLLFVQDGGSERVLSNVCTHRGAVMVDAPCAARTVRCPYHGRRFRLDGAVAAAPGFDPIPDDPLPTAHLARFGPWAFAAVHDPPPFADWIAPLRDHLPDYRWDTLAWDPSRDRDHEIDVPWMVYVENYLEGLHIPFVHPELARTLDLEAYSNEVLRWGTLQTGFARPDEPAVPGGRADRRVAAYYFWLFPTTMVNVYPWGVSLNLVQPVDLGRCRVQYRSWVADPALLAVGAGGDLDLVEEQDQDVVRRVWRGLRSQLYTRGRYSPSHEAGVQAFHRQLAECVR